MSFPKWVSRGYGMGEILCTTEAEEAAVHTERAARENPEPTDEVQELRAKLDAAGIKYHHKHGAEKLRALLPQE